MTLLKSGVVLLVIWYGLSMLQRKASATQASSCNQTAGATDATSTISRAAMAAKLEGIAKAQDASAATSNEGKTKDAVDRSTRDIMPDAPQIFVDDPEVKRRYAEALDEYYKYRVSGYQHRQRVFAWQLFSSKFIFVTVLLLVFLGMYFAALQFHAGLKFLRKGKPEQAGLATSLELSPDRGKVDSPVLGVIILLLSLGFFYLYLLFVYPIRDTF